MADQIIRPADLPTERSTPVASEWMVVDNGVTVAKSHIVDVVTAGRPTVTEAKAIAGTDAFDAMTAVATKQSIASEVGVTLASKAQGDKADTAVQPSALGSAAYANTTAFATAAQGGRADSAVQSVVAGTNVSVNNTDPRNPVVSVAGGGTGDMVGPASSIDGDIAVFNGASGKQARSGGISDPMLSVSPIPIDMHFATLAGVGWSASEPGNIVATTTTAASSTNSITVASASTFFVGQLICYVATDAQYYSVVIKAISGATFTLDRTLPVPIASGGAVYNFYRDDAHPNTHGYACLADDAIRQARIVKELVHVGANPAQWAAFGSVTLTNETTSSYAFPGSTIAAERAVRVTGSAIGAGVVSAPVRLDGGTYETQVVLNPGNRTGGFSGFADISVIATYSDGSTRTVADFSTTAFGDAVRSIVLTYRVPKGATVSVRVATPVSGPWTFWVGMIRHSRITGRLRDLNHGRHVVFGDSWAAGGDFVTRLTARLPRATIINKGLSGDTSTNAVSRFDADMAGTNPSYVWVILGTNDVYAQITPAVFQANMDAISAKIQALGATPVVFNTSVCDLSYVPAPGPRLDLSRQYAIGTRFADQLDAPTQSGTFTPAWVGATTNPAIGNGTITGVWAKSGPLVTNVITLTMGSTTTYGAGTWTFGLSEPSSLPLLALGGAGVYGFDAGTSVRAGMSRGASTASVSVFDLTTLAQWSPTVPQTWAVGDQIAFTISFISTDK